MSWEKVYFDTILPKDKKILVRLNGDRDDIIYLAWWVSSEEEFFINEFSDANRHQAFRLGEIRYWCNVPNRGD